MDYNNVNTWRLDQDNRRRATEILIGAPVENVHHETAYRDTRDASHEEVLARVRIVGVERTAKEYGIKPKVIRRWLKKEGLNNKSMSKDTMKKTTQEENVSIPQVTATVPQEGTRHADTQKNPANMKQPAPQTQPLKKSQDFSPEERKAIVARAKEIGTQKAAEEAGTTRFVVMSWERNDPDYKKFVGRTPAEDTPTEAAPTKTDPTKTDPVKSISTEVIPGSNGLPSRKEHVQDYSIEDRLLLIAKAEEVGNGPVSRAYGLSSYTIPNWKRPLTEGRGQIAAPKKSAAKKPAVEKKPAEKKIEGKSRKQAAPIALGAHANPVAQQVTPAAPAVPSTPAAPSEPVTPAAPVHTPAPAESVTTAIPAVTAQELKAIPTTPTQELVDPVPSTAPSTSVTPTASAAAIHTDVSAPQGQAYEPPAPMYTLPSAPVAPTASDTIEMIRLKDRVASLEERVETLRKVILELI